MRREGVLTTSLFNICMDCVLGRVEDQSHSGALVWSITFTDLDFVDDAVLFTESPKILVIAVEETGRREKQMVVNFSR